MAPVSASLQTITSELLNGLSHGFFTRRGGASSGVFEGLNCGYGSSDQSEIVALNRARVAEHLGVKTDSLITLHQTHSSRALKVDEAPGSPRPEADAIVTNTPGMAIAVLTADCQPILLADHVSGVIGAAHAGWKGALDGVLEETIELRVDSGADRGRIRAAIGPTISQGAYEVGPEFLEQFMDDDPENHRFFANGSGDRYLFDLPAYGLSRLRNAGVAEAEWTRHCTYRDSDLFYSYRRARHAGQADYGRLISAIRL